MDGQSWIPCTAKSKQSGERCKRRPIPGGRVCVIHGGKAPNTVAAAKRRILEAADPVTAELLKLATTAESESVRLGAAKDILDRAGLKPSTTLELTGANGGPVTIAAQDAAALTPSELDAAIRGLLSGVPAGPVIDVEATNPESL